jgi:hypothetical protein
VSPTQVLLEQFQMADVDMSGALDCEEMAGVMKFMYSYAVRQARGLRKMKDEISEVGIGEGCAAGLGALRQ